MFLIFLFGEGMLLIQNWCVYHNMTWFSSNGNFLMFYSGSFGLCVWRLFSVGLRVASRRKHLSAVTVALGAVIVAQVVGGAVWLVRGVVASQRIGRFAVLVLVPFIVWGCWRVVAARKRMLVYKMDDEGLGGQVRFELQQLVWQAVVVAEQCLVISYVVGVLPAAFSSDPHLFVDTVRCCLSAICTTVSTCALLGLWTLHSHRTQLRSLAGLLGSWQACGSAAANGRGVEWSPLKGYSFGSVVAFRGLSYRARGPFEANLAQPDSKAANALFMLAGNGGEGILQWYGWAVVIQTAVVGAMVLAAWLRRHYVVEMFLALINSPSVFLFLWWRRDLRQTMK